MSVCACARVYKRSRWCTSMHDASLQSLMHMRHESSRGQKTHTDAVSVALFTWDWNVVKWMWQGDKLLLYLCWMSINMMKRTSPSSWQQNKGNVWKTPSVLGPEKRWVKLNLVSWKKRQVCAFGWSMVARRDQIVELQSVMQKHGRYPTTPTGRKVQSPFSVLHLIEHKLIIKAFKRQSKG